MNKTQTWSASFDPSSIQSGEELVEMAGRWGIGLNLVITKPFTYSKGPIETIPISPKGLKGIID
jgi:hypothetical protein